MRVHPKLAQVEPKMILKCLKNINDPDPPSSYLNPFQVRKGLPFWDHTPGPPHCWVDLLTPHSCPYLRMWVLFPELGQRRITSSQPWV